MSSFTASPLQDLSVVLQSYRPHITKALTYSFIAGILVLAPTVYMFEVYGRVVNSRSVDTLVMLTVVLLFALVIMEFLNEVRADLLREGMEDLDQRLSTPLYRLGHLIQRRSGKSQTGQFLQDLHSVREGMMSPAMLAALELPSAVLFLVILFLFDFLLGSVALGAAVLQAGLSIGNHSATHLQLAKANQIQIADRGLVGRILASTEAIRGLGMLTAMLGRHQRLRTQVLGLQSTASQRAGSYQAASKALQVILGSTLLGLSAYLLLEESLLGGAATLIVASTLGGRALAPITQLIGGWRQVIDSLSAYRRLTEVCKSLSLDQPTMSLPAPKGEVTVENLMLTAPGLQQLVLRGVRLQVEPGQVVGIIGPSASGKSSLARALTGLWAPHSGAVRLDGVDISKWDKAEVGAHIGYLPQDSQLFEGSLLDNISRFALEPDLDEVDRVVAAVGLASLVDALPQGLQTLLSREGAPLSGGQRQKVALARALYGRPKLVVLDEPNASLDEQGNRLLIDLLKSLKATGATVFVITHTTGLLEAVDHLLVLVNGEQRAFGPRDQVLEAMRKATAAPVVQAPAAGGALHA